MADEDSSGSEGHAIKNDTNPFYDSGETKGNPFDDDDSSSSSGSECRPHFLRDSSGSDSDYHRYMKSNFITEVYHAKDYDYSTNDDDSMNDNTIVSSRSSSFVSAAGSAAGSEFIEGMREHALAMDIAAADKKYHGDCNSSISTSSDEGRTPRRPQRLSNAEALMQSQRQKQQALDSTGGPEYNTLVQKSMDTDDDVEDDGGGRKQDRRPQPSRPSETTGGQKQKQSSITSSTSSSSGGSSEHQHQQHGPTKPPKPAKPDRQLSTTPTASPRPQTPPQALKITVTSTERSLVTSGVEASFYLDGDNKCLVSSPTSLTASTSRHCEDMFLSQFIPSPKSNVKSLSWHISITDNAAKSAGYQLSIYKVLLRRSKSWCGGNNWALFIDGKHVANGKVPLFTMSSQISFEMPLASALSEGVEGGERQRAVIEIKRKAWYRRKLTYKFKIGGNEYPTFYAQPVDLFQSLPPVPAASRSAPISRSKSDPAALTLAELELQAQTKSQTQKTPTTESKPLSPPSSSTAPSSNTALGPGSAVVRRGSAPTTSKVLSSAASTLKSSASASALQPHAPHARIKSVTRMFSPAQMLITIPSTNTELSASGKQKIYYQILIRIPALPQPIVVERRYKHFSQLCTLLRGELALTLEETLRANGRDKENKGSGDSQSISSSCEAKLNQFPTLPPRVYNPMVNQQKPDFIKTRRLALQSFLIELMSYDPKVVHSSEFLGFLGLHPITCTSILKA